MCYTVVSRGESNFILLLLSYPLKCSLGGNLLHSLYRSSRGFFDIKINTRNEGDLRNTIPIEVKRKCIALSNQGRTAKEIYTEYYGKLYDTKYQGFQRMLRKWKKKIQTDEEILDTGNLMYDYTPHATTVQINANNEIVQTWVKSKAEDRLFLELIDNIQKLPKIYEANSQNSVTEENYMLEIPLFDLHFGIGDFYYYEQTLKELLEIIKERQYKEIVFIIGQDLFHANDFKNQTANGTVVEAIDICTAWNDARKFYYKAIMEALKQSGKVKVVYSKGNHDESMAWAFVQMIKAEFGEAIEVDDSTKDRKYITFGINFIGITHGENGRSRSNKLANIFMVEYIEEFARCKNGVREIHAGHLHHEVIKDEYGVMLRRLSSAAKTDNWHYEKGFIGNHKRFQIFEWSKTKLAAIYYI